MSNEEKQDSETSTNTEQPQDTTTETKVEQDTTDWKAEALKQRAINERLSKKLSEPITKKDESPREVVKPSDILRAEEFNLYREGYTNDEIDLIMKNGGRSVLKDEKNPLALGLKIAREQRQAEEASSRAAGSSGSSDFERKYSREDLNKMKPEEIEKMLGVVNQ